MPLSNSDDAETEPSPDPGSAKSPTADETARWAQSVPMPEEWQSWAFSSFFAHNLQHLAGRLIVQPPA